jgi:SAM-dependent methyltransferase
MAANSLLLVPCPLCGAHNGFLPLRITRTDLHIRKYGALYGDRQLSEWKACGRCGFVHQNPRPTLDALRQFYVGGQYHPPRLPESDEEYLAFSDWYYSEKIDYAVARAGVPSGRVLEIGCGLGGALRQFAARGWTAIGIEPDPTQADYASRTLGLSGVRQGLVDERFDLGEKIDLAFSNHAFEHFADLHAVMRGVARVLRPGGVIFTAVPTYYRNRSRLSKSWMNSSHYSLFTHRSVNQLMARHGFEEICHTYRGWRKEIDDLWHVARFTGQPGDPLIHFEDPRYVQRYVNVYNPLRTVVFSPFYAGHARRVALVKNLTSAWAVLRRSPSEFMVKVARRCLRAVQGHPR